MNNILSGFESAKHFPNCLNDTCKFFANFSVKFEWSKAGDILQREAYNPTTDIRKVSYPLASRKGGANEATYRLDGIVADETTQGIVISNQKKIIRR